MKLGARILATMAVAFVMVPALYPNDAAKSKATAKKGEPAASIITPTVSAKDQPDPAKASPVRSPAASRLTQSSANTGPTSSNGIHKRNESGNYPPKVEWFLGYSFWRAMLTESSNRMGYLQGGSTSVAYNLNKYVGLVADFGGYGNSRLTLLSPNGSQTVDADGAAYTYVFGPRFSYRKYERFTPFFQALFGGVHASSVTISRCAGDPSCTLLGSDNTFTTVLGAGFDVKISRHVALRPFQGDFLLTHFRDSQSISGTERGWQNNARFSTGVVFRFGGGPAPLPSARMTATCSADREMVYAGSGDLVAVSVRASNSENNSLNYAWTTNGGAVEGSGLEVLWNSSRANPGTYTVEVRVDDGHSGTADCSANIRVEPRPNRPPTLSCAANHTAVTASEPVEITATAADPDNDPLTFSWTASGGRIEGSGSSATLQTADLSPGSYTITGHVDDGRTGTADCTAHVDVQAAPLPPEVKELETRLALHSIYFPTARPTAANPTGGLVESQQGVLLSLANDFNRYLTFERQAHLILEGHADRRGSIEFNKDLTERRVDSVKSFLVAHGIPAANIETRSLGKEENLDAEQVKHLVEQHPDLSDEERQRIENNLYAVILANNRRVDISLSTTGQQSVRQYPFNAKDSLTLLSTEGDKSEKSARPPAQKKTAKP